MQDEAWVHQLAELVEIIDASGIDWWVSCGTLLGLVRDGHLKEDDDIDIECWAQPHGWDQLRQRLVDAGYHIRPHPYRGMLYKLWLTHDRWTRPVDIDVLRESDGVAWYPVKAAVRTWLPLRVLRRLWRSTSMFDGPRVLRVLRLAGLRLDSVQVPARLLDDFDRMTVNGVTVPVPARTEEILRLHYGDWSVPVSDWDMSRDDGTYVRSSRSVAPEAPAVPPTC